MEESISIKPTAIKYGLSLGIALLVYSFALQFSGQITNQPLTYLSYAIMLLALIFGMKEYRESNNGFMAYGQGLSLGTLIVFISMSISSIFSYIYMKFIDDSVVTMILDSARTEMAKNPQLGEAEIEQAMKMTAQFTTPEMLLVFGILGGLFVGFIISLLVAAFMKRDNPTVF